MATALKYRLTEAGAAILAQAERVAAEAETVERLVELRKRDLAGVIRVTAPTVFADVILTPWLAEFIDMYPDIKVEVIATERCLDVGRGGADIAVRAGRPPREPGILVRKLAACPWGLYCSQAYAAKYGAPTCADDLNDHLLIGMDGQLSTRDPLIWLGKAAPRARIRTVCSTISNTLVAVRTGHGVGALPRDIGIAQKDLVECFSMPDFNYGWYLVTREALKRRAARECKQVHRRPREHAQAPVTRRTINARLARRQDLAHRDGRHLDRGPPAFRCKSMDSEAFDHV